MKFKRYLQKIKKFSTFSTMKMQNYFVKELSILLNPPTAFKAVYTRIASIKNIGIPCIKDVHITEQRPPVAQ
nr:hypothetical protein [Alkaliphilus sp. B6464]